MSLQGSFRPYRPAGAAGATGNRETAQALVAVSQLQRALAGPGKGAHARLRVPPPLISEQRSALSLRVLALSKLPAEL